MAIGLAVVLLAVCAVSSAATVESRQMGPGGYGMEPVGGPMGGPPPGGMMGGMPPPPMGGAPPMGGPGPFPFPLKDPGFAVTSGFEGFLVPNSWWGGLLPWGLDGVLIVGGVILVVVVFVVLLGAIFAWPENWWKDGGIFAKKADNKDGDARGFINSQPFLELTTTVLDAIDKYSNAGIEHAKKE